MMGIEGMDQSERGRAEGPRGRARGGGAAASRCGIVCKVNAIHSSSSIPLQIEAAAARNSTPLMFVYEV